MMRLYLANKTFQELSRLSTYEERIAYLKLDGRVGDDTFGFDRYLNQALYRDTEWKKTRQKAIIRDNGCNLGLDGYDIGSTIIVHHINPISKEDIVNRDPKVFDLNNLVCVSKKSHDYIHYGVDDCKDPNKIVERTPNDTIPWRK